MILKLDYLNSILKLRIVRYLLVGACCASVDLAIFSFLINSVLIPWLLSSVISTVIATLIGYYLSIRFVFKSEIRFQRYQEVIGVLLIGVFALLLHQLFLYLLIEVLELEQFFSKLLVICLIFFFNYFSRSRIVFRGFDKVT